MYVKVCQVTKFLWIDVFETYTQVVTYNNYSQDKKILKYRIEFFFGKKGVF